MIPYSLLKVIKERDYVLFNPIDNSSHHINFFEYRILEHCDGDNTVEEIAERMAGEFNRSDGGVLNDIVSFLTRMTRDGMISWRKEKLIITQSPSPPSSIFWDITRRCNLRCVHCYNPDEQSSGHELSTDEVKRALDEISAFGVKSLSFSGGEPLMRDDFLDIVSHAANLDFDYISVATNGTLVNQNIAERLKIQKVKVQVSIDGDCADIHDRIRGVNGAFEKALQGLDILMREGVHTTVCSTISRLNVNRVPEIITLMKKLGVQEYRFQGVSPSGRGKKNESEILLSPREMKNFAEFLMKNDLDCGGYSFTLKPPPEGSTDFSTNGACSAGCSTCSITADGNVVPCTYFWGMQGDNIRDHTFQWIWKNSRILNYFRNIALDEIKGHCRECEWLSLCHGGCKAENFMNGDIFASNRYCWVANEYLRRPQQEQTEVQEMQTVGEYG